MMDIIKEPITEEQMKELSCLLEIKGADRGAVQRTLLDNIEALCFFLRGKLMARHLGKTIRFETWCDGSQYAEIDTVTGEVVGAGNSTQNYILGEVFYPGAKVVCKKREEEGKILSLRKKQRWILGEGHIDDYEISAKIAWNDGRHEEVGLTQLKII